MMQTAGFRGSLIGWPEVDRGDRGAAAGRSAGPPWMLSVYVLVQADVLISKNPVPITSGSAKYETNRPV